MLSQAEYVTKVQELIRQPYRGLLSEFVLMEQRGEEATAVLIRGSIKSFGDLLQFWVHAVRTYRHRVRGLGTEVDFIPAGQCRPLDRSAWEKILDRCLSGPYQSLMIQGRGVFIRAWQMVDEWNEVSAVAEYAAEYVAVFWDTGA